MGCEGPAHVRDRVGPALRAVQHRTVDGRAIQRHRQDERPGQRDHETDEDADRDRKALDEHARNIGTTKPWLEAR